MTHRTIIASGLALALVAGSAIAQSSGGTFEYGDRDGARGLRVSGGGGTEGRYHGRHSDRRAFERLDADGDGMVTALEFSDRIAARHAAMDADGDGAVTAQEAVLFAEGRPARRNQTRAERMLARLDVDDSGSVTLEEMRTGARRAIFDRLDVDGTGTLSKAEIATGRVRMREAPRSDAAE